MTRRAEAEAGLTLLEVIVTVAILGVLFVVLTGGTAASVFGSEVHRKQATAETVLRTYAEAVKAVAYVACGTNLSPSTGGVAPAGYDKQPPTVKAWDGSAFVACPTADTHGLQLVSLEVRSSDGRAAERIDVVKRQA